MQGLLRGEQSQSQYHAERRGTERHETSWGAYPRLPPSVLQIWFCLQNPQEDAQVEDGTAQKCWTPTRETRIRTRRLELMRGGPVAAHLPEHSHAELQVSIRFLAPVVAKADPVEINIYAPHQSHSAGWGPGSRVVVFLLSQALLEETAEELSLRGRFEVLPLSRGRDALLESVGETLLPEFSTVRERGALYLDAVATFLAGYVLRKHSRERARPISSSRLSAAQMRRLHTFIDERMESGFDVLQLAGCAGLGPQEFAQRLRTTTGMAPWTYVQRYRITAACRLLKDRQLSLAEITHRLGFSSQSHFTNAFRSRMRTTPGLYRKLL
ncbi:helix-turn-helix transcriptional regulator [Acidobacteria bacterium AB60]|nr:helix-turn-helix transcriptional regulator [Acidobacteria bacterium AB60]